METSSYHPFQSAQAQEEYLTRYDRKAEAWPVASEARRVDTSYGQTFVKFGYWLFEDSMQKDETSRRQAEDIQEELQLASRSFKPKAMVLPKVLKDKDATTP